VSKSAKFPGNSLLELSDGLFPEIPEWEFPVVVHSTRTRQNFVTFMNNIILDDIL